jgi:signal transduction histidine kinase
MSTMILHDLKNPLSVIEADVQYALGRVARTDPEAHEALLDAKLAVQRIGRIAENLLHLTRLETGIFLPRRAIVSVESVVHPLVDQRRVLARERGVTIEIKRDRDPARLVELDVDLVSRALENVFDNAFRHTPAGGKIIVETTELEDKLRIAIGNTGAPLPLASRERIFDKYAQAALPGSRVNLGLGLYFCRLVAESHGGRIWIEERSDLPFTVVLELPTPPTANQTASP